MGRTRRDSGSDARQLNEKECWLGIKLVPAFRNRQYVLAARVGGPRALWHAPESLLIEAGLTEDEAGAAVAFRRTLDIARLYARLGSHGISMVTAAEPHYPRLLREAPWYPEAYFIKGELPSHTVAVAIVGARRASLQGKAFAAELAAALTAAGVLVVSGGARGIDTAAHNGALEAGGVTVAVLGCGLDIAYPPENRPLFARIAERGALISEYPPGTQPFPRNFPARNRIVAGMCSGVVVVEAGSKSGALITADFALECGRDVFAVPGNNNNPLSKGGNSLIKQGAYLIESAGDILEALSLTEPSCACDDALDGLSELERDFIERLGWEPKRFDEILRDATVDMSAASTLLVSLEITGHVRRDMDGCYLRVR